MMRDRRAAIRRSYGTVGSDTYPSRIARSLPYSIPATSHAIVMTCAMLRRLRFTSTHQPDPGPSSRACDGSAARRSLPGYNSSRDRARYRRFLRWLVRAAKRSGKLASSSVSFWKTWMRTSRALRAVYCLPCSMNPKPVRALLVVRAAGDRFAVVVFSWGEFSRRSSGDLRAADGGIPAIPPK